MMVYEFNVKRVLDQIRVADNPARAFMGYASLRTYKFRRQDLLAYGLVADDIDEMLDRGTLREVEVDRNEAISIAAYHRCKTDTEYLEARLANLKKARESITPEMHARLLENAVRSGRERIAKRRQLLMERVIIPEFGIMSENGRYSPPEEVPIGSVARAVERYPGLLARYPKGLYRGVMSDIRALGLKAADRTVAQREKWEINRREDPELMKRCRARAANATESKKSYKQRRRKRA